MTEQRLAEMYRQLRADAATPGDAQLQAIARLSLGESTVADRERTVQCIAESTHLSLATQSAFDAAPASRELAQALRFARPRRPAAQMWRYAMAASLGVAAVLLGVLWQGAEQSQSGPSPMVDQSEPADEVLFAGGFDSNGENGNGGKPIFNGSFDS